jgi:hypothetical protein
MKRFWVSAQADAKGVDEEGKGFKGFFRMKEEEE